MTRVLVLGASGMLGLMVVDVLAREPGLSVTATARDVGFLENARRAIPEVAWSQFEATQEGLARVVDGHNWVVNAIGLIKPYVRDDVVGDVERAVRVNALFPHELAHAAGSTGARVLQIATDCVYSGRRGQYKEDDPHDAEDVYGKTKSLGEVRATHVANLRCSIIGPELRAHRSLLDWFRKQPQGASLNGFSNHLWNGVTTLQFAEAAAATIRGAVEIPVMQHLVPADALTKAELLRVFASAYARGDVAINDKEAEPPVDRTLATRDGGTNRAIWAAAGYSAPPKISTMVERLARFNARLLDRPTVVSA